MKIIDLLNKIANEEDVPYRIKYIGKIYEYVEEMKWYLRDDMKCELSNSKKCLNDTVEIIEEKKIPEKLDLYDELQSLLKDNNIDEHNLHKMLKKIELKQNEIIDYLKSKGE